MSIAELSIRPNMVCTERLPREELAMRLTGAPETLSLARTSVAEFARRMPFTVEQIDDIKLAVGEAVANAIRHGSGCDCGWVELRATRRGNALRVTVADRGCGFVAGVANHRPSGEMLESGRGITLMRALMDSVEFRKARVGTRVVMTKCLA